MTPGSSIALPLGIAAVGARVLHEALRAIRDDSRARSFAEHGAPFEA